MAMDTRAEAPSVAYPGAEPVERIGVATPPLPPHVLLIFGATGDLARRKLLPGLLHLYQASLMPEFRVVGVSVEDISTQDFRDLAREACREFAHHDFSDEDWGDFARRLSYVPVERAEKDLPG